MAWDVMSGVTKMAWDVMSGVTKTAWDVLSGVANLCGMFCPGVKKWHGMFWPGMFRPAPLLMWRTYVYFLGCLEHKRFLLGLTHVFGFYNQCSTLSWQFYYHQ